jgi:hypothetical protein
MFFAERPDIGNPKLFIGGAAGRREAPAVPTVNNFVAATGATAGTGWPLVVISCIRLKFSRPGGPGLRTSSR